MHGRPPKRRGGRRRCLPGSFFRPASRDADNTGLKRQKMRVAYMNFLTKKSRFLSTDSAKLWQRVLTGRENGSWGSPPVVGGGCTDSAAGAVAAADLRGGGHGIAGKPVRPAGSGCTRLVFDEGAWQSMEFLRAKMPGHHAASPRLTPPDVPSAARIGGSEHRQRVPMHDVARPPGMLASQLRPAGSGRPARTRTRPAAPPLSCTARPTAPGIFES